MDVRQSSMCRVLPKKKERCLVFSDKRDHLLFGCSRRHDARSQVYLKDGHDLDRQRQERQEP